MATKTTTMPTTSPPHLHQSPSGPVSRQGVTHRPRDNSSRRDPRQCEHFRSSIRARLWADFQYGPRQLARHPYLLAARRGGLAPTRIVRHRATVRDTPDRLSLPMADAGVPRHHRAAINSLRSFLPEKTACRILTVVRALWRRCGKRLRAPGRLRGARPARDRPLLRELRRLGEPSPRLLCARPIYTGGWVKKRVGPVPGLSVAR